jgi:hypothetical protein
MRRLEIDLQDSVYDALFDMAFKNGKTLNYMAEKVIRDSVAAQQSVQADEEPRCPKCGAMTGWHYQGCEDYTYRR